MGRRDSSVAWRAAVGADPPSNKIGEAEPARLTRIRRERPAHGVEVPSPTRFRHRDLLVPETAAVSAENGQRHLRCQLHPDGCHAWRQVVRTVPPFARRGQGWGLRAAPAEALALARAPRYRCLAADLAPPEGHLGRTTGPRRAGARERCGGQPGRVAGPARRGHPRGVRLVAQRQLHPPPTRPDRHRKNGSGPPRSVDRERPERMEVALGTQRLRA
jgi:hypothetical protein